MERPIFTAKALEAQRGQGSRENRQRRDTEPQGFAGKFFGWQYPSTETRVFPINLITISGWRPLREIMAARIFEKCFPEKFFLVSLNTVICYLS